MRHHRARVIRGILASVFVVLVAGYPAGAAGPTVSGSPVLAPQYTTGDITGDGKIDTQDLDKLERNLGKTDASPGWSAVAAADLNGDHVAHRGRPGPDVAGDHLRRRDVQARSRPTRCRCRPR